MVQIEERPSGQRLIRGTARAVFPQRVYTRLSRYRWLLIRSCRRTVSLLANYRYDLKKFARWSSAIRTATTPGQLAAIITIDYHRLEKGLALPHPRHGFGKGAIRRLSRSTTRYCALYGADELIETCVGALAEYVAFNAAHGVEVTEASRLLHQLRQKIDIHNSNPVGGTTTVTKSEIHRRGKRDLDEFFRSRFSVRNFTSEEVDLDQIEQAVRMAQKTPSVCNRQSCRVHVFCDDEDKQLVLSYQNGNRGFGSLASKVLIVTSDLQSFNKVGERYQCWIDGGMFAMSLVYALHSLGLGTCTLNWSVDRKIDRELRRAAEIPDNEAVIMMIAVGHLPCEFSVAQSPRKPISDVMNVRQARTLEKRA